MASVGSTPPNPPSLEEMRRKAKFFQWKCDGGNTDAFLKDLQAKNQEAARKKLEEAASVLKSKQTESQEKMKNLEDAVTSKTSLTVNKDKLEALQATLQAFKEAQADLSRDLDRVNEDLKEQARHKAILLKQLDDIMKQKDRTPFANQETFFKIGQTACQNIANNHKEKYVNSMSQ